MIRHFEGHQYIELPHLDWDSEQKPGWLDVQNEKEQPLRPLIKCQCGALMNIPLHHVYADGRIFASLLHQDSACGWHVFGWMLDYHGGEHPPETKT
jgi:hypothetical protein